MNLSELTRYDKELVKTRIIYGLITLCAVCTVPIMYYVNLRAIKEVSSTGFVTDPNYQTYLVQRRPLTMKERQFQLENHARGMWETMWNVNKSNIERKIDIALERSDESAEMIYQEYFVERGLEGKIMESNWKSELTVLTCEVDMSRSPAIGTIKSRWTITRPGGFEDRHLDINFAIVDSGISPENPYGAEMKSIDIFNNIKFVENE